MSYLLVSLPGGPFRIDTSHGPAGRRFSASEICNCGGTDTPHWHELGIPTAASLTDLMADLLGRHLEEVATP